MLLELRARRQLGEAAVAVFAADHPIRHARRSNQLAGASRSCA